MFEMLDSSVTKAVFSSLSGSFRSDEQTLAWLGSEVQQLALQLALARAYIAFIRAYPQLTASLFEQHPPKDYLVSLLTRCLTPSNSPNAIELAAIWADHLGWV